MAEPRTEAGIRERLIALYTTVAYNRSAEADKTREAILLAEELAVAIKARAEAVRDDEPVGLAGIAPCCGHGTTAHADVDPDHVSRGCYAKQCRCKNTRTQALEALAALPRDDEPVGGLLVDRIARAVDEAWPKDGLLNLPMSGPSDSFIEALASRLTTSEPEERT